MARYHSISINRKLHPNTINIIYFAVTTRSEQLVDKTLTGNESKVLGSVKMYLVYYIGVIVLSVVSIVLHGIGFYTLWSQKKKTNQTIALISLSTVDTIISLYRISFEVFLHHSHMTLHNTPITLHIFLSVFYTTGYAGLFTMTILTLDRFVCALNPLMYAVRMPRRRTTIFLIVFWMFSLCIGVATGATPIHVRKVLNMFSGGVVCLYLFITVLTYVVIFTQLKKSRQLRTSQQRSRSNSDPEGVTFRKEFCVPLILISTFIVFYAVPLIVTMVHRVEGGEWERRQQSMVYCLCMFLPHVGVMMDALTYIFFVEKYRKTIVRLWWKGRSSSPACSPPGSYETDRSE